MIRQGWTTKEKLEKEASDNEKILKITRADSKTKWAVIFMLLGMVLVPFGSIWWFSHPSDKDPWIWVADMERIRGSCLLPARTSYMVRQDSILPDRAILYSRSTTLGSGRSIQVQ